VLCPGPRTYRGRRLTGQADGCPRETMIEPVWMDYPEVMRESIGQGTWHRGDTPCEHCRRIEASVAVQVNMGRLQDLAGLPPQGRDYGFDAVVRQGRGETWTAFRGRLDREAERHGREHMGITPWNATAARLCREWRPTTGRRGVRSLLLVGPVGGGKTTLALALANGQLRSVLTEAVRTRPDEADHVASPVLYITEGDLYERLAAEKVNRAGRVLLQRLIDVPLLLLDDLGTFAALRPWHTDVVEHLLAQRYNHRRPMVITSNLHLDDPRPQVATIGRVYGERVRSRVVQMVGGARAGLPGYLEVLGYDWRTDMRHVGEARVGPEPEQRTLDHRSRAAGERADD